MAALQSYIIQNFGNNKDLASVVERAKEQIDQLMMHFIKNKEKLDTIQIL